MDNERFKLVTRRCVFWGFAVVAALVLAFIAVWGCLADKTELVTLGGTALATELGAVIAFLTAKKLSEE